MAVVTEFRTNYMDTSVFDLEGVIEHAKVALEGVDFDTLVGTGFSGGIVIPALALALGKQFVLIRKEDDDSHHGGGKLLGRLGEKWIFFDDFVSSGRTRTRVMDKIGAALVEKTITAREYNREAPAVTSTMVGQYMYVNWSEEGAQFEPFNALWTEDSGY